MATSYTTKTSSDEMFKDLENNPGFAYEVSQTWNLVKKLLKKRKEFNGVNLKKITEPQWQEIHKSITQDEKDRRLFNPIIANRNRPAIDDPELWLYGPISEDTHIQDIISKHLLGNAQEAQSKEKTKPTHNQPGIYATTAPEAEAKQPVGTTTAPTKMVTPPSVTPSLGAPSRPEADFMEQARQQLLAASPKTPPTDEAVQLRAYQLRQHVLTGEHFQAIKEHATGTPSQPISSPTTESPSPIILANKSGNVIPQAPGNPSAIITSSRPQLGTNTPPATPATPPLIIPHKSFPLSPPSRTEINDEGEVEEVTYSAAPPDYDQDTRNDEEPRMRRRRLPNPRRLNPRGATRGARGAAQGARGAAQAVRGIATLIRAAPLFANPYVLGGSIAIGVILLIVIIFKTSGGDGPPEANKTTAQTATENAAEACKKAANYDDCINAAQQTSGSGTGAGLNEQTLAFAGQAVLGTQSRDSSSLLAWGAGTSQAEIKEILANIQKSIVTYDIRGYYPGQADDIKITDPIPSTALFISASGKCHVTKVGNKVTEVWWSVKENQGADQTKFSSCGQTTAVTPSPPTDQQGGVRGTSTQNVSMSTYTQFPYFLPAPSGSSDTQYSAAALAYFNTEGGYVAKHQSYLISKTKGPKYVDPFLSVIWTGAIEGIGDNQFFYNCHEHQTELNEGCAAGNFSSGNWQVGYGMQVSQATPHIVEDFNEAYGAGSASNAQKTQQVGQAVIAASGGKIRNPSTFPSKSTQQLASEAMQGNLASRQAIAILLMDKELGAIAMAREIAGDISIYDNWAQAMRGWGSYYSNNLQLFSNRAQVLAQGYNGSVSLPTNPSSVPSSAPGSGVSASFPALIVHDKVLPLVANQLFTSSQAIVEVIGARGGTGDSSANPTSVSDPTGTIVGLASLDEMFNGASKASGVPAPFIKGINMLETGVISTWTDADVKKFSQPNWWVNASQTDIQRGWAFNQCDTLPCFAGADVRGIMQFELQTWNGIKPSISKTVSGHDPDRRYPADSIVGAGIFIRDIASEYDRAFGTSPNATSWPENKVRRVATAYCTGSIYGDPNSPACNNGGAPYDDIVWRYYKEFGGK